MKKLFLPLSVILFTNFVQAQILPLLNMTDRDYIKKLKSETLVVQIGQDENFDQAVKYAFNKYWTYSKVEFKKDWDAEKGTKLYLYPESENHGLLDNYHICNKFSFSSEKAHVEFDLYFDNDHTKNNPDNVSGIDKNYTMMSYKIIQYVMLLCSEFKRSESDIMKYARDKNDHPENLSGYKILIPQEHLSENLSKESFTNKLPNCEFLPSSEIYTRVLEQKNIDNCAQILLSKAFGINRMYFVDLKTGKLLHFTSSGSSFGQGRGINNKDVEKMLKKI